MGSSPAVDKNFRKRKSRHVNTFIHDFKSRLEDISVARDMFDKNDCLFGFDLKSAYIFL